MKESRWTKSRKFTQSGWICRSHVKLYRARSRNSKSHAKVNWAVSRNVLQKSPRLCRVRLSGHLKQRKLRRTSSHKDGGNMHVTWCYFFNYLVTEIRQLNFCGTCFSVDKDTEKEAKLAELREKKNAILDVLRNCSKKLENLRSIGAPNYLQEVKEQQDIVTVNK